MLHLADGLPDNFSLEALASFEERVLKRHLFANLDRAQFETRIFTRPVAEWPIGHLQDHRVSVPAALADESMTSSAGRLSDLLSRFLSASGREGAQSMIAEALGLNPVQDARRLIQLRDVSHAVFKALLLGRLNEIWMLISGSGVRWNHARSTMRMMLLYYGALELQLIAARARSFADFDLGAILGGAAPTVGGLINGWDRDIESVFYAFKAASEQRPAGRTPSSFAEAEEVGRAWLARLGLSEDDPAPKELVDLLSELQSALSTGAKPAIKTWRATAERDSSVPLDASRPKKQPVGARMEVSTLFEGMTSGQQIGYASLRLESLARHGSALLQEKGSKRCHFDHWNRQPFGRGADGPSLALYFVNQAVIVKDLRTCLPGLDLAEAYSDWCNQDEGGKASSLLKSIRARQWDYIGRREPVGDEDFLPTAARADILPDYRLGIRRTSLSGEVGSALSTRRHELPAHIQKHGLVRQPRWKSRA